MVVSSNAKRCRRILGLTIFCLLTSLGFIYNVRNRALKAEIQEALPDEVIEISPPETSPLPTSTPCSPRSNILFLKTHKCASSAIQNIFLRYGDHHHLVFALPPINNYLGHPNPFNRNMLPSLAKFNFTYNIFAHHTRFNYREMQAVMPKDTIFITVVRNPVDLFESMFSYFEFSKHLNKKTNKSLEEIIQSPDFLRYFPSKRILTKFGFNQMLFDLGFDPRLNKKTNVIEKYIDSLDSIFDLVMVAERMEESLILLKDLLCWSLEDVVTFKTNRRANEFKKTLSASSREKLLRANHADDLLYKYFEKRLDDRIQQFGKERMAAEVAELRNLTAYWYDRCIETEMPNAVIRGSKFYINKKVMSYRVKQNDTLCTNLAKAELVYTDNLLKRQAFFYPPKPEKRQGRAGSKRWLEKSRRKRKTRRT